MCTKKQEGKKGRKKTHAAEIDQIDVLTATGGKCPLSHNNFGVLSPLAVNFIRTFPQQLSIANCGTTEYRWLHACARRYDDYSLALSPPFCLCPAS
jgi:hypothetical protein